MAFDSDRSPSAILDEIGRHPQGDALAELVHALAFSAYDERRASLDEGLLEAASRLSIDEEKAETSFGNVLQAARKQGAASGPERTLLGALVARGVALSPARAADAASHTKLAEALAWISAHTVADPLAALAPALDDGAVPIWRALGEAVRRHDEGAAGAIDRASAIVAASALARLATGALGEDRATLSVGLRDPFLIALLEPGGRPAPKVEPVIFDAEETPAPRHAGLTIALLVTLLLPFVVLARLFARHALRLRRPAQVTVSPEGILVRARTEVLGKTLRDREVFMPKAALARAAREVRFPALALYVGLVALLAGSYVGVRLAVQGVSSGSPSLLGLGALILIGALTLDYLASRLPGGAPTRCGMLFERRKGRALALRGVERIAADAALKRLSG